MVAASVLLPVAAAGSVPQDLDLKGLVIEADLSPACLTPRLSAVAQAEVSDIVSMLWQ